MYGPQPLSVLYKNKLANIVSIILLACAQAKTLIQLKMFKNFNRIVTTILKRGIQANVAPREDFNFVPIGRSAQVSIQDRFVCVEMENGEAERIEYKYPSIWLRDNCQCSSCYHLASKSRIINWQEKLNYNLLPKSVKLDGKLRVVWNDNHSSDFELDWLQARSFNVGDREKYLNKIYRPRPRLWSKTEFDKFVEHFKYDDIVSTRQGLRKWLQSLAVNGCAFIHDAPQSENACRQIANLVGFIKKTHYGEEFIVRARESTNNAAYLSAPLQMHTDLPYYEYKPGVSLLHCLVQSKSAGAANLLVDGFYVAERMRMEHPDFYRILTSTLVNWSDYGVEEGNEFEKVYRAPVIGLVGIYGFAVFVRV